MVKDSRVVRGSAAGNQPSRARTQRQRDARRGPVTSLSPKSRGRLLWHVRNTQGLGFFLTLTYAGPVTSDDRECKRHLDLFKRWAVARGVGLVWKQEFGKRGRPHFHLMTIALIDVDEARARWAEIVGCEPSPQLVESGPIRDRTRVEWYMAKRQIHPANRVPDGFGSMGRWWGHAGPGSSPVPLATVVGEESEIAPVVRAVKAAQEGRRGKTRKRRDDGVTSRRLEDAGGEPMARDAARYAQSLGLGLSKPITEGEEKGFLAPGPGAEGSE